MTFSQSSSAASSAGVSDRAMPALQTRMSTRPFSAITRAAAASTCFEFGDLHLDDVGRVALGFHRRLRLPRRLEIAVGDIDMGAGLGQRLHAGEANPLPAAGDDGDATLEIEAIQIHGPEASIAMSSAHPVAAVDAERLRDDGAADRPCPCHRTRPLRAQVGALRAQGLSDR